MSHHLKSFFRSGDALRSRSVGDSVRHGTVDLAPMTTRLTADWQRETVRIGLEAGEVEPLPLARARARWPDHRLCLEAAARGARMLGIDPALAFDDVALMACRGARYHHDGGAYGSAAFLNVFLTEDKGLDLHYPATGLRIPLTRGSVVLFDTGQPHAVIPRGSTGFDAADFAPDRDALQVFLTWELPIERPDVARALGVDFDVDPATAAWLDEEQVRLDGARVGVCPASGRWHPHTPT